MSRIQVLSPELISQIAAGEVIERPASAVKELLENSIDAGATTVSVEIEEGGLKKIRVVDNGMGMDAEDAQLAFERHATSKIHTLDDLFHIQSLGFRGEALASIASIARVVMRTRRAEDRLGVEMEWNGGKQMLMEESAADAGTDITIWGLFQHTPARKKYMKSERTEYGHIFDLLCQTALAHPKVGFRFLRDGKEVFILASGQSLKDRLRTLYGSETVDRLIPVQYHQSNLLIQGFVGKPELSQSSNKYQWILVNGRPIQSRLIDRAVKDAFHSLLMHEKYPWYVLSIEMDPTLLDVNVHPRKWEVRFLNTQEMYRVVMGAVHHALQAHDLHPVVTPSVVNSPLLESLPMEMSSAVFPSASFASSVPREHRPLFEVKGMMLRPLAQIAQSYILAESEEGLVLIDQHAAHERVRYTRLMEALERETPLRQGLLSPLELDLGVNGARLVEGHLEDFSALGFELEPFGGSTFLIRSVPAGLDRKGPDTLIREILSDLEQEGKQNPVKNWREALLTTTACRGAIKFGDPLMLNEMESLLKDMESTLNCTHCPHGRPALITFTFDQLEVMFRRKNV